MLSELFSGNVSREVAFVQCCPADLPAEGLKGSLNTGADTR